MTSVLKSYGAKVHSQHVAILSIFLASTFLRLLVPAYIVPNSPNDDLLGVLLADSLIKGDWLGLWNPNTLSKPPGYSIFLALVHFLPIRPLVALHFFYLLVVLLLSRRLAGLISPTNHHKNLLFILFFATLAFNPAVFGGDFSRIYRTSLNTILVLLFAYGFLELLVLLDSAVSGDRTGPFKVFRISRYWKVCALLGLAYASIILTRSEGSWILLPSLFALIIFWVKKSTPLTVKGNRARSLELIFALPKILILAFIVYIIPIGLVSAINYSKYGVKEIENFYTGNFADAIREWASVKNGQSPFPFISISKEQRAAVYEISPSAKSLKSFLDGPPNTGWKSFNCSATKICDESGAWFPWELRQAAVETQQITNEVQFQNFFGTLAQEIRDACEKEKIRCSSRGLAPGARPLLDYPKKQIIDTTMKVFGSQLRFDQAANVGRPDNGQDPSQLALWRSVVKENYLIIPNEFESWQSMSNTVTFLKDVYTRVFSILFFIALFSFLVKGNRGNLDLRWFLASQGLAILIFAVVLAIFESSLGFGAGLSLYALPSQPLLLLFCLVGSANLLLHLNAKENSSKI